MKKLRKAIALLVGMVMVFSLIPQIVLAAQVDDSYLYGWERADGVTQNGSTVLSCVTSDIAHSGSNSLLLKHEDESQNGSDLKIKQGNLSLGEGTYTLSFWAAGTVADHDDDPWRYQQIVWMPNVGDGWFYVTDMTIGETDGDWTHYSKEFTVESGKTVTEMSISIRGYEATGLFLDDFTLVKQGTTNNLLKNGSFDFDGKATYTPELDAYFQGWVRDTGIAENGSTIFTCVTDKIAHSGNHSFVLKSLDTGASDLAFKQTVGLGEGTYTLSFWAAGTAADHDDDTYRYQQMVWLWGSTEQWAYLSNMYTGEKDGDWAKYTLTFTVPAGATVSELKLSTRGHGTEGLFIDDFTLVKQGTTNNLLKNGSFDFDGTATYTTELEPYFQGWERDTAIAENGTTIFTCVTDKIAHSGNHSFVLKSLDTGASDLAFKQTVGLGEGTYTLSFWAAGTAADHDDDTYRYQQMVWLWGSTEQWAYLSNMYTGEKDGDWAKYTLTFTVPAGATVGEFKLSTRGHGTEGLYIDDISIVKSGSTENLLTNGGFEEKAAGEDPDVPEVPEGPTYTTELEPYFQGWERSGGVTSNTTNVFACVTNEIAHSGNNSVVLKHTDSTQGGYMQIQQTSLSLSEGTYTLSFWVAGEVNGQQVIWIKPGTTTANGDWLLINSAVTGETEGDWTKYSTTFNVASGNTVTELTIGTSGNTNGLYLDDISIVKAGTTSNLVKNGSFDFNGSAEYTDAYEAYFIGWGRNGGVTSNTTSVFACVTNKIAHSGNNSVVLKHTDSTQGGYMQIQQTSLSLSEGTYTLSFWVAGEVNGQQVIWIKPGTTTANGDWLLINSAVTGETEGDWTKYSTTFNVASGNTVTELTIGTSGNTNGLYLDDISIVKAGTTSNLVKNGSFDFNGSAEYTDAYEAYFTGWDRGTEVTPNESTVFTCVTNAIAHSGSNSVALKHSNANGYIQIQQNNLSLGEGTYTLSFWAAGKVNDGQTVIWIKPGTPFGENDWSLVANAKTNEVEGMWTKYSTTFTVEPEEGIVTQLMIGTQNTPGLYLDDISIVKSGETENLVKNGGFEQKGLRGYYVSTPKVVKIEGENRRELTALESGNLEISLEVANYSMGDNFAPILIVALYNGGTLESIEFVQQGTSESALDGFLEDEISFTVEVPEMTAATAYQLKVMCWDNLSTLTPLVDALELE